MEKREGYRKSRENMINFQQSFVNEDVEKMVKYLKDNYYINPETSVVETKGVAASEISECNEIMLTEIISNDFFLTLEAEERFAISSSIY